jgi:diacylglycerol kinase (ATP)
MATPLLASFGHALRGLVEVTAHQRNMKLHVLAGTAVGLVGTEVALPLPSRLALVFSVMLVLAAEMGNSALESLVDLHTRELRDEARRVKDAAAGGVLALAAGAVVVALAVLFGSLDAFRAASRHAGVHAILGLGVLLLEGYLLFGRPRSALLDGVATAVGAVLVSFVGFHGASAALSLVAGTLFALAAASAAFARRSGPA